jgi:hypothetical protein
MTKRLTFSLDIENDEKAKLIQAILDTIHTEEVPKPKKKLKK